MVNFLEFVHEYLLVWETKCYRHCREVARLVCFREGDDPFVGGYVCPGRHVSRVVYVAKEPQPGWLKEWLSNQVGESRVREKDIRFATRHGWELGSRAEEEIRNLMPDRRGIRQYYWVFYPKNKDEEREGTFLCPEDKGGCGKLFTKSIESSILLCQHCAAKTSQTETED